MVLLELRAYLLLAEARRDRKQPYVVRDAGLLGGNEIGERHKVVLVALDLLAEGVELAQYLAFFGTR